MKKLEFRGSRYELQQVIKKLNGVMDTNDSFRCIQKVQNGSKPSGISFRFDCTIRDNGAAFTVGFRVRPTAGTLFLPVMLLLVLAACIAAALVYDESWLYSGILGILLIASVAILLVCRQKCTGRFLRAFEKQHIQKKRI